MRTGPLRSFSSAVCNRLQPVILHTSTYPRLWIFLGLWANLQQYPNVWQVAVCRGKVPWLSSDGSGLASPLLCSLLRSVLPPRGLKRLKFEQSKSMKVDVAACSTAIPPVTQNLPASDAQETVWGMLVQKCGEEEDAFLQRFAKPPLRR